MLIYMLCSEQIGWRTDSRKIIILLTDAEQHYALDGILGGLTKRFDMSCKLEKMDLDAEQNVLLYGGEQDYDYPSFGQVREGGMKMERNVCCSRMFFSCLK